MLRKLSLGLILCAILAGQALSADIEPVEEPIVSPLFDWSGFYVGAQAGYGWGDSDTTVYFDTGAALPTADGSTEINGFIGGVHAGWNWQGDALVLGIEGDINFSSIDGAATFPSDDEYTTDVQLSGSLRARLGYALDRALIYATGGLAIADVELGAFEADFGGIREEDNQTYVGFTVGGGLEYAFTDALSARVEYRYTDLGEENFNWATSFPLFNADYDIDFHTVQVGLSWHF